jgi:hypothetical protein
MVAARPIRLLSLGSFTADAQDKAGFARAFLPHEFSRFGMRSIRARAIPGRNRSHCGTFRKRTGKQQRPVSSFFSHHVIATL